MGYKKALSKISARAFSIVEVIIVVFIIGIISTITLANYRSGARRIELTLAAQKLALDIRRAQQLAVTTRQQRVGTLDVSPCGYGIYFGTTLPTASVRLFAETTALPQCAGTMTYDSPDEQVEDIQLSSKVQIINFSHAGCGSPSSCTPLAIGFLPPTPVTVFTSGSALVPDTESSVEITLALVVDPTLQSTVRVLRWGQIIITGP